MHDPGVSAVEAIRVAMQLLLNEWQRNDDRTYIAPQGVNLAPLISSALAEISRWTCVQWGVGANWWSFTADAGERRNGTTTLRGWFGSDDAKSKRADISDETRGEIGSLLTAVCDRCRSSEEPCHGPVDEFGRLVSAFENALQIVGETSSDGRIHLTLGKANTEHARRRSGSYYTPDKIVQTVLEQTLTPALRDSVVEAGEFLTSLRVVDPACGAGLFLVAAAKHITERRLRSLDAASECPVLGEAGKLSRYARLFRKTVEENIYGVDVNPWAVDWCRLWLWSCAGDPKLDPNGFAPGLRVGNALIGAPVGYWRGVDKNAWKPTELDDKVEARRLRLKHASELAQQPWTAEPEASETRRLLADGWCAAFFWLKVVDVKDEHAPQPEAPTYGVLVEAKHPSENVRAHLSTTARQRGFFHWTLEFGDVYADGGFDVVVGNPPWIAHAGRASHRLEPHTKHYLSFNYTSFAGYPSTHGLFVERAVDLLKPGGRLGFVLPSSVSELGGYKAAREAHDRGCDFEAALTDFGEGCFPGVTQPCMALISRRRETGRAHGAWGSAWPVARDDLDEVGVSLLTRLASMPTLAPELFGERGIQSDARVKAHLSPGSEAHGRFTTPVREGADIREFRLGAPRLWADWQALGRQVRNTSEYEAVKLVLRQTANYTIATLYDGLPFRNSLLAGFGSPDWSPAALVALLNSTLIRWHHYMRHRDARQPVLPQVKIGHLRAIPQPLAVTSEHQRMLTRLATEACANGEMADQHRSQLDLLVAEMYGLSEAERSLTQQWAQRWMQKTKR